jgi:hypothetical protein
MNIRDLLQTLDNCEFSRKFQDARNPKSSILANPLPVIDWAERTAQKNVLLGKYLKIMVGVFFGLLLFLILPIMLSYPAVAKSMVMGIPPMIFMSLSWMVAAWYAWDKNFFIFIALTVGGMPVRCGLCLAWAAWVIGLEGLNLPAFIFGMMAFWVVFIIPEIAMLIELSTKFPRNGKQVEPCDVNS